MAMDGVGVWLCVAWCIASEECLNIEYALRQVLFFFQDHGRRRKRRRCCGETSLGQDRHVQLSRRRLTKFAESEFGTGHKVRGTRMAFDCAA